MLLAWMHPQKSHRLTLGQACIGQAMSRRTAKLDRFSPGCLMTSSPIPATSGDALRALGRECSKRLTRIRGADGIGGGDGEAVGGALGETLDLALGRAGASGAGLGPW